VVKVGDFAFFAVQPLSGIPCTENVARTDQSAPRLTAFAAPHNSIVGKGNIQVKNFLVRRTI